MLPSDESVCVKSGGIDTIVDYETEILDTIYDPFVVSPGSIIQVRL
jgi:hypothetical protein